MEMPNGYPKLSQQDGCIEYHKQDKQGLKHSSAGE